MTAGDDLSEIRALAAAMRESIAILDAQIEQRAQKVAAERVREFHAQNARRALPPDDVPEEDDHDKGTRLLHEGIERMDQLGELWRQRMLNEISEDAPEARAEVMKIPAAVFTASAALLLFDICLDTSLDEKRRGITIKAAAKP